jgi:aspartate dehydrogenase
MRLPEGRMAAMKVGLVGCGNIASDLCEAMADGRIMAEVSALTDVDADKAERLRQQYKLNAVIGTLDETAAACDFLVEAAVAATVPDVVRTAAKHGVDCLIMSLGGLMLNPDLFGVARQGNVLICQPSGAICGLDGIRSAMQAGLDSVTLTTCKPPAGLKGAPYLVNNGISLDGLTEPFVVFDGSALDAVKAFPANVNVAAALSLAGIGAERTKVRVVADPAATTNSHEIVAIGPFGELRAVTNNRPSPKNPKSSYLASLSAIAELRAAAVRFDAGSTSGESA